MRLRRDAQIAGALALLLCVGLWLGGWAATGEQTFWPRFADDAYYYFVVAENVWAGRGLSMDGVHMTNGFQPLWMVLCLMIFALPVDPTTTGLALAQGATLLVFAAGAAVVWQLTAGRSVAAGLVAMGVLAFPRYLNVTTAGMESGLALLLCGLVLLRASADDVLTRREAGPKDSQLGWWVGLLLLTRLDAVWMALSLAAVVAGFGLSDPSRPVVARVWATWRKGWATFWPVLLLVVPYLLWNKLVFGHVVPISGILKSSFPEIGPHWAGLKGNALHVALVVPAAGLWVSGSAKRDPAWWALGALVFGAVVHVVETVLFMGWAVLPTHFGTFQVLGAVGVAAAVEATGRAHVALPRFAAAGAVALSVLALGWSLAKGDRGFGVTAEAGGRWAEAHLPPDAFLAMKDSGVFTFFARRPVANLDGIISDLRYQQDLCDGRLEAHLREIGVDYVVQHWTPGPGYGVHKQLYPCHLNGGRPGELLLPEALEVYRGPSYRTALGEGGVVVWRAPWAATAP